MPTDADLMRLSETVRGSYILFERDHKSLVCICMLCGFDNFTLDDNVAFMNFRSF